MRHILHFILISLCCMSFWQCEQSVTINREAAHWEYEHPDWQNIGYLSCGGNSQSPVDIDTDKTIVSEALPALDIHFSPFELKLVDNGHTIQVNAPDQNNFILYNGVRYNWVQLHFHHHSEHQINQEHTDMELHCVHRDSLGNLLVLTFMIVEGAAQDLLEEVFNHFPGTQNVEISPGILIDLNEILPADLSYYTYYGSLTTPPCSATVQFVVLKSALTASAAQIDKFAARHENNYRPVQPLNNRFILEKRN